MPGSSWDMSILRHERRQGPRGYREKPRWIGDNLRWIGDNLRWIGDNLRWIGDNLRWIGDNFRWIGEKPRRDRASHSHRMNGCPFTSGPPPATQVEPAGHAPSAVQSRLPLLGLVMQ